MKAEAKIEAEKATNLNEELEAMKVDNKMIETKKSVAQTKEQ